MWFAKHITTILLVVTHLGPVVIANESNSGSQLRLADTSLEFRSSSELGIKEPYTKAKLKGMFKAQQVSQRSVDLRSDLVSAKLNARAKFVSALVTSKTPMSLEEGFTVISDCETLDSIIFGVKAVYNGKFVHFESVRNVDKFNETTLETDRKAKTVSSKTKFYHSACRAVSSSEVCFYTYSGTVRATFWLEAEDKSADITMYTQHEKQVSRRPQVTHGCLTFRDGVNRDCTNWNDPGSDGKAVHSELSVHDCSVKRILNTRL